MECLPCGRAKIMLRNFFFQVSPRPVALIWAAYHAWGMQENVSDKYVIGELHPIRNLCLNDDICGFRRQEIARAALREPYASRLSEAVHVVHPVPHTVESFIVHLLETGGDDIGVAPHNGMCTRSHSRGPGPGGLCLEWQIAVGIPGVDNDSSGPGFSHSRPRTKR